MEVRHPADPVRFKRMNTDEVLENFLVELFQPGEVRMVYSHVDRAVAGSVVPTNKPILLEADPELAAEYFARRREVGVINIGNEGSITVDGTAYKMEKRDALYISRGSKEIKFDSSNPSNPAQFYVTSYPAHTVYPTTHAPISEAEPVHLGSDAESNKRTIYKYIHPAGIKSCQLVMGLTELADGNVWNTMPPHTHARRMEIYLYFDIPENAVVFHYMGEPNETRHIVVRNGQAIISPSWSIHAGCGTSNYSFIWGMGGENQEFGDMDGISMDDLR